MFEEKRNSNSGWLILAAGIAVGAAAIAVFTSSPGYADARNKLRGYAKDGRRTLEDGLERASERADELSTSARKSWARASEQADEASTKLADATRDTAHKAGDYVVSAGKSLKDV